MSDLDLSTSPDEPELHLAERLMFDVALKRSHLGMDAEKLPEDRRSQILPEPIGETTAERRARERIDTARIDLAGQ